MDTKPERGVAIERVGDEWVVQVLDGDHSHESIFSLEASAESYADGQRLRMGLYPYDRRAERDDNFVVARS